MNECDNRLSAPKQARLLAVPLLWCFVLVVPVFTQDQTISQMVHTSWTGRDGAPQGIFSLAQTPDGVLWIDTFAGLFTFDGVKFDTFHPKRGSPALPGGTLGYLFVSKAGDLWVFPLHGPPIQIHQREVRVYDRVQGEELFSLFRPQQDTHGTLWAVLNERHLVKLGSDNIWHQEKDPVDTPGDISQLFIDSSDTQWVIQNEELYRRSKEETKFTATSVRVYGQARITENQDHTLWVLGQETGPPGAVNLQHVDETGRKLLAPLVRGQVSEMLFAHDGSLWISSDDQIRRYRSDALAADRSGSGKSKPDLYDRSNSRALLNDLDGNIWVGGAGGLDRFQRANLTPAIPDSKVGMWHSCVDTQGEVWIANANGNLQLFSAKNGHAMMVQNAEGPTNLFCGVDGLYLIGDHGISVVRGGHILRLPLLPGLGPYGNRYRFAGVIQLAEGDLVASIAGAAGHGLWKYRSGKWSPYLPNLALPEICGMLMDNKGRLYVGFTNSADTVGRIEGGSLTTLTGSGALSFAETTYGVVAYGRKGIALDRGKEFQRFSFLHAEEGRIITGVVESRNGDLWINGARGIVRIPAAEVRTAMATPDHAVSSFNLQEGNFVGPDLPLFFRNSAHLDRSGRLWFSTMNGVVSVEPDQLGAPPHPPLLCIRSIVGDGHEMDASSTFAANTYVLEVRYLGVDLTDPRRVVYRYRLKGLGSDSKDSEWLDVGPTTQATYTNLRPGTYAFQVMASNGNDVWTPTVSSLPFTILPHFYERWWFQAACVVAGVFLVWLGFCGRVRSVSRAIRIREEGRADERIRIARELHDTLLQGVQGLLLAFHVASEKVPADHESRKALERALSTADRIILEGRNRVNRLRSEPLTDSELKPSIEGVASELNGDTAVEFVIERKGGDDTLQAHVVDEIFCIAREALTNAFRHSEASRIAVELDYQRRHFRFNCSDNGHGFDSAVSQANQTNGHWGLRGMAERAEKIGAKFSYASSPDKGTDLQVLVPARRAYVRTTGFRLFSSRRSST